MQPRRDRAAVRYPRSQSVEIPCIDEAAQQADAADEAGASDGASQLIRGVGPTSEGGDRWRGCWRCYWRAWGS